MNRGAVAFSHHPAGREVKPDASVVVTPLALITPIADPGVLLELSVSPGLVHGQGCRCEVGRKRSRSLDFVALNITTRPKPGQGKVTVRNINCTNQFPMNDQPGMGMS